MVSPATRVAAAATAVIAAGAMLLAAPAADAAGRGTTHVHVTKKHTVIAPASLRPGIVHLRNDGSRPVVVLRKKHEGIADLIKYANATSEAKSKKIFTRFGFVEVLAGHADSYVRLARGTYFLADGSDGKLKARGVDTLRVRGRHANASRPTGARTLRITGHGVVRGATTGKPRPYLRLRNTTAAPRVVEALKIKASATPQQISAVLRKPSFDAMFDLIDFAGVSDGVGFVGPHQDVTVRSTLGRGRYFVLTFTPFAPTAKLRPGYVLGLTLG